MGRNNRRGLSSSKSQKHKLTHKFSKPQGVTKPQGTSKTKKPSTTPASNSKSKKQHSAPTLPFSPTETILLIGEGDLSFARSLVESHHCTNVIATVYESAEELREKYPHVDENIEAIESGEGKVKYGIDVTKLKADKRKWGEIDRVFFNFPHVGGKSRDVNRQVRYNQELLVSFFHNITPLLSPRRGSSIIVTLFEGEPYTLWNIRDLGRHSGLQVEQSFKFQAGAYPGYKHARTLGVVKGKDGSVGGGWKGEERSARSFVFVRKGEAPPPGLGKGKGKEESDSSEDEDMEEDIMSEGLEDGKSERSDIDDKIGDEDED